MLLLSYYNSKIGLESDDHVWAYLSSVSNTIMRKSYERHAQEDEIIQFTKGLYDFIFDLSVRTDVPT